MTPSGPITTRRTGAAVDNLFDDLPPNELHAMQADVLSDIGTCINADPETSILRPTST